MSLDIVLASFGDRDIVAAQFASSTTHATYLPVTAKESERDLAKGLYDRPQAETDSFRDFLKAVHRSVKQA